MMVILLKNGILLTQMIMPGSQVCSLAERRSSQPFFSRELMARRMLSLSLKSSRVLSTSYLNRESSAVVRFINPVEAKGIKIQALNPTRMGLFGIGELTFYAEN